MRPAARSLYIFSFYAQALGLITMVAPGRLVGVVGLAAPVEPYVHIVGLLLICVGYYYRVAARNDLEPIIRASVVARASIPFALAAFALLGLSPWVLTVFGVIDLAAALWTFSALRRQALAARSASR